MKSKQVALIGFVVLTFAAYSWQQRHEGSGLAVAPTKPVTAQAATAAGPASQSTASTPGQTTSGTYKDGTYTGSSADAFYGNVQVQVSVSGGKISDVQFLQYPNEQGDSRRINSVAMPYLKQEAIQAQSANVDGVSGATDTSMAFVQSLQSALQKAQA